MSLHPFRSIGSRTAALATAGVIGASALLGSFPAAAQLVSAPVKGAAPCDHLGPTQAGVQCSIKEMDRRIEDNIRRGAAAQSQRACTESLMAWAQSDPVKQPVRISIVNEIRGGKSFAQIDSCAVYEQAKRKELNNG